jgi:hypothetical protein
MGANQIRERQSANLRLHQHENTQESRIIGESEGPHPLEGWKERHLALPIAANRKNMQNILQTMLECPDIRINPHR